MDASRGSALISPARGVGYTVVEGAIGVGKTSLARRLAKAFGAELTLESPQDNPFLERFYHSRRQYALPAQLYFLFQRSRQLNELKQGDLFQGGRITDFMLEKDRLFARVTLDEDELRLYDQVYGQLSPEVPEPDLVVYLQAPLEIVMERIRQRGIAYEQGMDRGYLRDLIDAYTHFFHNYDAAPLLIVNTAQINFADSDQDVEMLANHIRSVGSGRHYFNPLAEHER